MGLNDVSLPPVLFVLPQTDAVANGGIASISEIIGRMRLHRPIIVTDRETPRVEQWRREGIETHVVPQTASAGFLSNPIGTIRSYLRYGRVLRRLLDQSGAKIIHANNPLSVQLSAAAAKLTGTKLILNQRASFGAHRQPSRLKYRLIFAAVDHVLFLSEDMARRWREHVPNAGRSYSVTYSAVDPKRFFPTPASSADEPVVLISALIRPLKGQLEFLRHVAPKLAESGVKIWFAGDFQPARDRYMAQCAEAAAPLGDSVQFLGYRADIPELIARASVIAVTSHHEGLVRAMIEAMACGRPVVSFEVCSASEVLEKQSGGAGSVIAQGDYEGMAEAILRYCRDHDLAADAGEKGAATASRLFDPDAVVSRYEGVYQRLALGDRGAGSLAQVEQQ